MTVPPIFCDPLFQYGFGLQGFNNEASAVLSAKSSSTLRVYPNPFKNTFKVDLGVGSGKNHIRIVDVTGKTIIDRMVNAESVELNLSKCQSGLYNLIADGKNGIQTCKLLKE